MSRFLFTMLPANDLGLPTRLVPIARALADRGHEVAVFNPAPAPTALIADAGLRNLPMPPRLMPPPSFDLARASRAWDVEEMFAWLFSDEDFVRANTAPACRSDARLQPRCGRGFVWAVRLLGHACSAHPAGERPAGQFSSPERRIQVVGGGAPGQPAERNAGVQHGRG